MSATPEDNPIHAASLAPTSDGLVRAFVCLGVATVRITGGEPLLRRKLVSLIDRLENVFSAMTGGRGSVSQVLAGLRLPGRPVFAS
jgi:hypothetical protein